MWSFSESEICVSDKARDEWNWKLKFSHSLAGCCGFCVEELWKIFPRLLNSFVELIRINYLMQIKRKRREIKFAFSGRLFSVNKFRKMKCLLRAFIPSAKSSPVGPACGSYNWRARNPIFLLSAELENIRKIFKTGRVKNVFERHFNFNLHNRWSLRRCGNVS